VGCSVGGKVFNNIGSYSGRNGVVMVPGELYFDLDFFFPQVGGRGRRCFLNEVSEVRGVDAMGEAAVVDTQE
jgi:hypothetical protein